MRGKIGFAKFPPGWYWCQIEDVKAGIDSQGKDLIVVYYRVQEGARTDETFRERMRFVSAKFLEAIEEPHDYNAEWDTNHWRGKMLWVDVKYSPDENQWPRYGHHQQKPPPTAPVNSTGAPTNNNQESEEKLPF